MNKAINDIENKNLFRGKRLRLADQLRAKGIKNNLVLAAIEKIPRHLFFDSTTGIPALLDHAYSDKALPIGEGQTISHPYTVGLFGSLPDINADVDVHADVDVDTDVDAGADAGAEGGGN